MSCTETAANRPTSKSIARSFLASNKRHLLITGSRSSGKSTLLRAFLDEMHLLGIPGITTCASPGEGVYLTEASTGERIRIGVFNPQRPGTQNRMRPIPEAFIGPGCSILDKAANAPGEWTYIDEIGYLESECIAYCNAIESLMEKKRLIAVVRSQNLPFLNALRNRRDVFLLNLDQPRPKLGCVIMASGLGRRFGSNKLMTLLNGKPMIDRILRATGGIFSRRVVVTRHREVEAYCTALGIPVLLHSLPHRSDTIRLGLEAVGEDASGCIFCPGDQPLLSRETLDAMALCAGAEPEIIWRLSWMGEAASPVLFPCRLFKNLKNLPEGKGGNVIFSGEKESIRHLPALGAYELMDVDCPADLARILEAPEL